MMNKSYAAYESIEAETKKIWNDQFENYWESDEGLGLNSHKITALILIQLNITNIYAVRIQVLYII